MKCDQCFWLGPCLVVLICISVRDATIVQLGPCKFVFNEPCSNSPFVKMWLYTRTHNETPVQVGFDKFWDNLTSTDYNNKLKQVVIVHGYNANMNLDVLQQIKNNLLLKNDLNVWFVDWETLAAGPCLPAAVSNMKQAGVCTATFLSRLLPLYTHYGLHLIGFSLGAHVTSRVAYDMKPYFKIPRITGLDPANTIIIPPAGGHPTLSIKDAEFVDIVHTNAFLQGDPEPMGHVDFYMNGGMSQPGCSNSSNKLSCDHHRAPEYYGESIITDQGFYGVQCSSKEKAWASKCVNHTKYPQIMGYKINPDARGIYYVPTQSKSPYAMGRWGNKKRPKFYYQNVYGKKAQRSFYKHHSINKSKEPALLVYNYTSQA